MKNESNFKLEIRSEYNICNEPLTMVRQRKWQLWTSQCIISLGELLWNEEACAIATL